MTRKLGLMTIALALASGCSFHASMHASTRTGSQGMAEGSQERESTSGSTAELERQPKLRDETLSAKEPDTGGENQSEAALDSPQTGEPRESMTSTTATTGDRDRGHGNDADGVDEDNPGKSKRRETIAHAAKKQGDRDRGHGNDADGVDEDNPGKSKGRKIK